VPSRDLLDVTRPHKPENLDLNHRCRESLKNRTTVPLCMGLNSDLSRNFLTSNAVRELWAHLPEDQNVLIYILINKLTTRSTVLLEKIIVTRLVKKFPAFYGTWRFATASTKVRYWPTQPLIQWVPGALFLGVERPGLKADHSLPSTAEVRECVKLHLHSPNMP
jgi:hypothetical protein